MSMPMKRSSIRLSIALCIVASLVGAAIPLRSTVALQSGSSTLLVPAGLLAGLVDYWKFDEPGGNVLGAHAGKTFLEAGAVGASAGRVYPTAREYSGPGTSDEHVRDNDDVRFGDTDFSIALWWYQYTTPDGAYPNLYHYLIHQDGYDGGYTVGLNGANQVFFMSARGGGVTDILHTSPLPTPNNIWHFGVIWYTAADHVLHAVIDNGAEQTLVGGARAIGTNPVRIGGDSGTGNTMYGRIGPIQMWTRVLAPDERASLWNNGNGLTYEAMASGASITPTSTPLPPTATPTSTPTMPTNTPTPTSTSTATPTSTPAPTSTPTSTPTNTPTNTGLLSPSSNAPVAVSAGDNNGYEVSPISAYLNDGLFAADNNSGTKTSTSCNNNGKDKHSFYDYNVNLPGTATVKGIEVRLDGKADSSSGQPKFCVDLSWNGGASWTNAKSSRTLGATVQTFMLGSSTDNWGRTWLPGDLSNTNFRVRVIDVAGSTARDFSLDWVAVRVTYQ